MAWDTETLIAQLSRVRSGLAAIVVSAVKDVAEGLVVSPVEAELDRWSEMNTALATAAGA